MRIAFLHQPNDPYTEVRIRFFVKAGHTVWSIVFPNKKGQKKIDGVEIFTLPEKLLNQLPFGKRLTYGKEIAKVTTDLKLDVLYVVSALNSYYLKASNAKRTFLEAQGSDVLISPDKYPFLKVFYRKYWQYATGITQDSEPARKKVLKYMPKGMKNETIEIGIDFRLFNENVQKGVMRKKLKLGSRPVIFHSRGIKPLYNLETVLRAAPHVLKHHPDVCFLFCGDESNLSDEGKLLIESGGIRKNVIFCGWVNHDHEMPYFNMDSDILLSVPTTDSSPFSVYEAMATKTVVIVSDLPWVESKFKVDTHLLSVPANDSDKLADTIVEVLQKKIGTDLQSAYNCVFENMNMITENKRLEQLVS